MQTRKGSMLKRYHCGLNKLLSPKTVRASNGRKLVLRTSVEKRKERGRKRDTCLILI